MTSWAVTLHPEVVEWLDGLTDEKFTRVTAALDALAADGPALGRPFVDTIKGSTVPNMKELRPRGGHLRMLFAFDPQRTAVVLVAGDKTDRWGDWYRKHIPLAERRFEAHLADLRTRPRGTREKE